MYALLPATPAADHRPFQLLGRGGQRGADRSTTAPRQPLSAVRRSRCAAGHGASARTVNQSAPVIKDPSHFPLLKAGNRDLRSAMPRAPTGVPNLMTQSLSANLALAIFDNCPFPLLVVNSSGRASTHNRAFDRLLDELRRKQLRPPGHTPPDDELLRVLLGEQTTISLTGQNGEQCHLEVRSFTLPEQDNTEVRIFIDVSTRIELERTLDSLNEEVKDNTLTDPVTGLLNQRGLMLALEPQVARSRRYNSPMSLITLSIQPAKNREAMLVEVARVLKDQLRWADLIGCTEQQDFTLVLPETTSDAASKLAAKLEHRLGELAVPVFPTQTPWFFFGVTSWRKSDNSSTLLKRGAQALARACTEQTTHSVAL